MREIKEVFLGSVIADIDPSRVRATFSIMAAGTRTSEPWLGRGWFLFFSRFLTSAALHTTLHMIISPNTRFR